MDNSRVENRGETHVPKPPGTADYTCSTQAFKKILILLADFLSFLMTVMRIWR